MGMRITRMVRIYADLRDPDVFSIWKIRAILLDPRNPSPLFLLIFAK
jgi:hypothetical protein